MFSGLQLHLGKQYQTFREAVRQFALTEIAPYAASMDTDNTFPNALWRQLGKMGLLGITVSEAYGGINKGYLAHAIAMEEISRVSAAVGLSYSAHSNLCVNQIYLHGNLAQKQRYLPLLLRGEYVGALAMSEKNAGSDIVSMQLQAQQKKDHFILNGHKMWITNGPTADVLVVYAKISCCEDPRKITAFLIEKGFTGFRTTQKMDKLGMRGSDTCELIFENCIVPAENVLGEINQGMKILMRGLDYERTVLAAGPVGIMQACLDVVLPYCHQRKQFNQAIGEFQFIQGKLADMYSEISASRAYLYAAASACDEGTSSRKDAAAVILYTAEKATQMALQAIQILGANGYMNHFPTGRLLRDAKLYEIGAGTSEIRRMLIGRELFKEWG